MADDLKAISKITFVKGTFSEDHQEQSEATMKNQRLRANRSKIKSNAKDKVLQSPNGNPANVQGDLA